MTIECSRIVAALRAEAFEWHSSPGAIASGGSMIRVRT